MSGTHVMTNNKLVIQVLGSFKLSGPQSFRVSAHSQYFIALLACNVRGVLQRAHLAEMLWPGSGGKGRHSLSQLIYELRRLLPHRALVVDSRVIMLNEELTSTDWAEFKSAVKHEHWSRAVELYTGRFLENAPYVNDGLDDWRISMAATLEGEAIRAYAGVIDEALCAEDHSAAASFALRALAAVPLHEEFARVRVQSLAASGDVARALRELEVLRHRYLSEVGFLPPSLSDAASQQIVRLASVGSYHPSSAVHLRIVGRARELAETRWSWHASAHNCQWCFITGEPGIGKTRLLEHTVKRAVLEGARPFVYTSSAVEAGLPYSGIVGLMRDGIRDTDAAFITDRWKQALAALGPELFPDIKSLGEEQPRVIWEAAAQFFAAAARRDRIVLAFDDCHWLDEQSLQLVTYIGKRLAEQQLFVMFAGRSDSRLPNAESGLTSVELRELSTGAIEEMIVEFEANYGVALSPRTRHMLISQVGGRPFFLVEAFRHLRDCRDAPGEETLSALLSSGGVAKQLIKRMQELPSEQRMLIFVSALINREMPLHALARIADLSPASIAEATAKLAALGIFADSANVRFTHDLMRELALLTISSSERMLWHARIAETLEQSDRSSTREIATHYEGAGEARRAYTFAKRAAADAMKVNAYADAEENYLRMLRCASVAERYEAQVAFTEFAARSSRYEQLIVMLPEFEESFAARGFEKGLLITALARFQARQATGQVGFDELVTQAREIVQLAKTADPSSINAVMWLVADHIRRSGDTSSLDHFSRLLARHAEAAGDEEAADMLCIAAMLGGVGEGVSYAEPLAHRAVEIARRGAHPVANSRALFAQGTVMLWKGDLLLARKAYQEALELVEEWGPDGLLHSIQSNLAVVELERGHFEHAEQMARAVINASPRSSNRPYSFGNLALIYLRQERLEEARKTLDQMVKVGVHALEPWIRVHVDALYGLVDLGLGRTAEAAKRAMCVRRALQHAKFPGDSSHLYLLLAKIDCLEGDPANVVRRLCAAGTDLVRRDYIAGSRLLLAMVGTQQEYSLKVELELAEEIAIAARRGGATLLAREASAVLSIGARWLD
jgi:DNA-binding SARP family transcriptional activator